jgi:hypothetical protein
LLLRHTRSVNIEDVVRHLTGISNTPQRAYHAQKQVAFESSIELKDVVQQILCFCNTDDGNWPNWLQESFQECRTVLQARLRQIYHRRQTNEKQAPPAAENLAEQFPSLSSSQKVVSAWQPLSLREIRSWKVDSSAMRRVIKEQFQRLKAQLVRYSSDDASIDRKQQIQVLVLVLCLTYGWRRHRKRILWCGQKALATAVWKPALEILEAFGLLRGVTREI